MRKKIVAANWKMNLSLSEGTQLIEAITAQMPEFQDHQKLVFCVPFTHLERANLTIEKANKQGVYLGAQNCYYQTSGAFTGEISIDMLKEIGASHVIIGHSERRQYFNETHELLKQKVDALVSQDMQVLFCCGEPLEIRQANTQNEFVEKQLKESLFHLSKEQLSKAIAIAYEPIWAIGTGLTASTEQAQEMHAFIRTLLANNYSEELASSVSILYGGSCNATNAKELFSCRDVDGGLIGGASLKAETFLPIIEALP